MRSKWNPFNYPPSAVLKSIWGFILPVLAVLADQLTSDQPLTWRGVIAALISGLVTGYGVFAVQNKPIPGEVTPAEAHYAEGGYASILLIVGVVLVILGLLGLFKVLAFTFVIAVVLVVIGLILVVAAGRGGTRL